MSRIVMQKKKKARSQIAARYNYNNKCIKLIIKKNNKENSVSWNAKINIHEYLVIDESSAHKNIHTYMYILYGIVVNGD